MDCQNVEKSVFALAENRLPREKQESMERHINQCERCRALAACVTALVGEMVDVEPSPFFWSRLKNRIETYEAGGEKRSLPARLHLRPAALAALVLLAIVSGIQLGSEYTARTQTSAAESLEEAEVDALPYTAILDGVPHGSLAEILLEETYLNGLRK